MIDIEAEGEAEAATNWMQLKRKSKFKLHSRQKPEPEARRGASDLARARVHPPLARFSSSRSERSALEGDATLSRSHKAYKDAEAIVRGIRVRFMATRADSAQF